MQEMNETGKLREKPSFWPVYKNLEKYRAAILNGKNVMPHGTMSTTAILLLFLSTCTHAGWDLLSKRTAQPPPFFYWPIPQVSSSCFPR